MSGAARSTPTMSVLLAGGLLAAFLLLRWVLGTLERQRIHTYVNQRGGRVHSIDWNSLGKG
jgi:hypothetical protein